MKKERKLETRRKKANLLIQERDSLTSRGSNGVGGRIQVLLLGHQWRKLYVRVPREMEVGQKVVGKSSPAKCFKLASQNSNALIMINKFII